MYFTPNDASGSPPLGLHPREESQRLETLCGLRFGRGWKTTTPDDGVESLGLLDTQGKGTKMVLEISCPGMGGAGNDACPEETVCTNITRLILSEEGLYLT